MPWLLFSFLQILLVSQYQPFIAFKGAGSEDRPSSSIVWLLSSLSRIFSLFLFQGRDESFFLLEGGMNQPSCFYIQSNQYLPSSFYMPGTELGAFAYLIYFLQACGEADSIILFCRRNCPAKIYKCCLFWAKARWECSFLAQGSSTAVMWNTGSILLVQSQEPNVGIVDNFFNIFGIV